MIDAMPAELASQTAFRGRATGTGQLFPLIANQRPERQRDRNPTGGGSQDGNRAFRVTTWRVSVGIG